MLLRLLQHDQTQVANECTIVASILAWWGEQPDVYRNSHLEQLKQLMQQIRMQHLSRLYIATFMMHDETVLSCFSKNELVTASLCTDAEDKKALQDTKCPQLDTYPAWTAEKRPSSNRQQKLDFKLPLSQLQEAVDCLEEGEAFSDFEGPCVTLQGRALRLETELKLAPSGNNSSERQLQLGVFLRRCKWGSPDFLTGGICRINIKYIIKADTESEKPCEDVCKVPSEKGYSDGQGWGSKDMLSLKYFSQWSDVEVVLRERRLVHKDECLHIQAEILSIK